MDESRRQEHIRHATERFPDGVHVRDIAPNLDDEEVDIDPVGWADAANADCIYDVEPEGKKLDKFLKFFSDMKDEFVYADSGKYLSVDDPLGPIYYIERKPTKPIPSRRRGRGRPGFRLM